jgi:hypothetical protein
MHAHVQMCGLHATRRCAYTNWSATARDCSDFFTDGEARSLFKRHIARVAFRVNTLTGLPYNQDPAIFGALYCILPSNQTLCSGSPASQVTALGVMVSLLVL